MEHKVIVEACEECSKVKVCKFVDAFKRYSDGIRALAESTCAPVKTNISCREFLKVLTLRAEDYKRQTGLLPYPDDGIVRGNHD